MIREYFRVHSSLPVQHLAPRSNPSVRERVNLMNAKLRSAAGSVGLLVDGKCKELIQDLEQVAYKADTCQIDKDRDRLRTHLSDALGYGDAVKESIKQVLWAIAAARQDGISIDVSGLDEFDIDDYSSELDDAKKLLDLGIGSETLKKQVFKNLALKYLCDARQEVKNQVAEEIDRMKYAE